MENYEFDLLNRTESIETIYKIIDSFSRQEKSSISFAIEGKWGTGKSWILNKLGARLYDTQDLEIAGGKYCVLKFNPWEYDYYSEPLLALLLSVKNQVEKENEIFPIKEEDKELFKNSMEILGSELLGLIESFLSCASIATCNPLFSILGKFINIFKKTNDIKEELDKKQENKKNKKRQINPYFDMEELMQKTIKGLNKISSSSGKELVILVDELDRCLPDYAIKVLERMHHITSNVCNIQVIYAIDKEQLSEIVRQIYGEKVPAKNYLEKFISFSVKVEAGALSGNLINSYSSLFKNFDFIYSNKFYVNNAFSYILPELTMRERNNVIRKVEMINSIINKNNEKKDYALLYTELVLAECFEHDVEYRKLKINIDESISTLKLEYKEEKKVAPYWFDNCFFGLETSHSEKEMLNIVFSEGEKDNKIIETVIYNLLKDLINNEISIYPTKEDFLFYENSFKFLYSFVQFYRMIGLGIGAAEKPFRNEVEE